VLYLAGRTAATALSAVLIAWGGLRWPDAALFLYGPLSTALLAASPSLRRVPVVWALDSLIVLALILAFGDWRSPFYLLWLATLALPAVSMRLSAALWLGLGASVTYLLVALIGGPVPGRLQLLSAETLAIHLSLPFLLVASLAYAADALRRLAVERARRERLAIEAERRRIAWELHDSAKQRLHAAHLLVSSLRGRVPAAQEPVLERATVELVSAASDLDTSLAELRSPLEGRPLEEALRARAAELTPGDGPWISVHGHAPALPPLVAAHVYRVGCEAITNALRHADAQEIDVSIAGDARALRLRVRDDGRGLPAERRPGASGLLAMRSRAETIGGTLAIGPGPGGRGTDLQLHVPLDHPGGLQ